MAKMNVPAIKLRDGREIAQLGVGTYKLDPADTEKIVGQALDLGYRHIDTAKLYNNEQAVGKAVAASGLRRADIWLTTKLWHDEHLDAIAALERSLERLGTEYVDLFLIHWPTPARGTAWRAWELLIEAQQMGLARSIGVSNFEITHLERIIADTSVVPAVNQIEAHPHHQRRALVEFCAQNQIAVAAWSPLARGRADLLNADPVLQAANIHGRTPAQIILRWHVQNGFIVFPKTANLQRLTENAQIFDFELSNEQMQAMDQLEKGWASGSDPFEMNG